MSEQQFKISIQTAAPTGPVDALERSMRNLSRETDRLNSLGTPEAARVSEFAFYDLDAQIAKTTNTAAKLPDELDRVGRGGRDNATALLMFSQAAEDAQYGIRGVLNNVPGLVMALGGGMGLAGAVSIAAVGISQLISLMGRTREEAQASAIDIETAANAYADAVVGAIDRAEKARQGRTDRTAIFDTVDTAGQQAEDNAYQARQDSIQALLAATNTLNELMGRQVVAQEAIAAAEAERARQREEEQQQAIKQENRKVEAAQLAVKAAEEEKANRAITVNDLQRQIALEEERVNVLAAQRAELEAQTKIPLPQLGGGDPTMAAARQRDYDAAVRQRSQAQAALDEFDQGEMANARAALEKLEERLAQASSSFEAAANEAFNLTEVLERQNAATQENIRTILEQGQVKQATDAVKTAAEVDQALAGGIKETLAIVANSGEELNGLQKGAVASLQKVMEDGRITQQELGTAITAMQQLSSMLVGDVGRLSTVLQTSINLAQSNQRRIEQLERQLPQTVIPGNVR